MGQKRSRLSRLSALLDLRALVTGILVLVVGTAVLSIPVQPLRDALEKFFTNSTWVWVLVLVMVVEAGLFGGAAWLMRRRRKATQTKVKEVPYGGVNWPVSFELSGGLYSAILDYVVGAPICPSDKTQLGLLVHKDAPPVPLETNILNWRTLSADRLTFKCFQCSAIYDELTRRDYGMENCLAIVKQLAWAQTRRKT